MLIDLYSKRQRRVRGETADVYSYDQIPEGLRVQIVHIIRDAVEGETEDRGDQAVYRDLHDALAREYGLFHLHEAAKYSRSDRYRMASEEFFLAERDIERALDFVELSFQLITSASPKYDSLTPRRLAPQRAVSELNARMREAAVGYQFESRRIVRVDSQLLHEEAVKPALHLLSQQGFQGANDEFLRAHEHYRQGRLKEALNEALKAFESTMKTICAARKWPFDSNAPASKLLEVCFSNELLPSALQAHFSGLRSTLEAGIPTVRNKMSGHGQGPQLVQVPQFVASYALNITAAAIRLLVEAHLAP